MEQKSCGGSSTEVVGRARAWLSCSVLSPASRPMKCVTAAVSVVVVVKEASSTQLWFSA